MIAKLGRKIQVRLGRAYLRCMPSGPLFAKLYYLAFDPSFTREQVSVYAGKREHMMSTGRLDPARFTLRRNIHRLEKGLIMRPQKKVFAMDYVEETLESLKLVLPNDQKDPTRVGELQWFTGVLSKYFKTIERNEKTAKYHDWYAAILAENNATGESDKVPFKRSQSPALPFSYEDLFVLYRRRRSVRWFTDKPVPRELIDSAILAALQSPSACNRQPFEFRIIDQPGKAAEIANIPMGTRGYSEGIPVMVVIVGKLDAYFDERDRHVIYVDGGLAAMSFMLALETLGLASCPINWPDIEGRERKMASTLKLAPWERPIMLVGLGFPDDEGEIPFSEKSPLDAVRSYES